MITRFSLLMVFALFLSCKSKNFSKTMTIEKQVQFNATKEQVWDLLTNPTMTKKYMFGCAVISDWKTGSSITWKGLSKDGSEIIYVKGNILECINQQKVTFTMFDPNLGLKDIPENYLNLTYCLKENNGETTLKLTQGNFATVTNGKKRYEESLNGWNMVIPLMKELIK